MWTALAEELAESARSIGQGAAAVTAACWRAGVDPAVPAGLIGAAVGLGAQLSMLPGPPMPDDREMVACVEDLAIGAAEHGRGAQDMTRDAQAALSAATAAAAAAASAEADAETDEARAEAAAARAAAEAQIGDCEAALEILADLVPRLRYVLACLQRVPDDLVSTYQAAYEFVAGGGKLPYSGEFLTEIPIRGAA